LLAVVPQIRATRGRSVVKVVLASRSPQRREILQRLGLKFEVVSPAVQEVQEGVPAEVVVENARRKARAVDEPGVLTIGCDTDVALDGVLLGKPRDEQEAHSYLLRLSGREHQVLSGLVVAGPGPGRERSGVAASSVAFRELGYAEVARYLASGEWRERAGGYAIQGLGSTLVARVEGDVSNVIGLPVPLLLELAPELFPPSFFPA
jgi:septum formation protein